MDPATQSESNNGASGTAPLGHIGALGLWPHLRAARLPGGHAASTELELERLGNLERQVNAELTSEAAPGAEVDRLAAMGQPGTALEANLKPERSREISNGQPGMAPEAILRFQKRTWAQTGCMQAPRRESWRKDNAELTSEGYTLGKAKP